MGENSESRDRALLVDMFEAFNRHDAASVVTLMTEDCVFEGAAGPEAHGVRFTGREAVRAAFENVWTAMSDVAWEVLDHRFGRDFAITRWMFRGTRADGKKIEVLGCDLFEFRDGLVSSKQAFRKDRPPI